MSRFLRDAYQRLTSSAKETGAESASAVDSIYDDREAAVQSVSSGAHRDFIGGMWDEMGALQLAFLQEQGLQPSHSFLDLGCGSLRAGVHLIPYLDPGKYWGIDINQSLLDAGWEKELKGLQSRQPREQLVVLDDFQFDRLGTRFDMAIATSVFTHLGMNRIRRCLGRLAPAMNPGGVLYATVFETPDHDRETPLRHDPGGVVTHSHKDPFHYSQEDVAYMAKGMPWQVTWLGAWNHPRDQQMVRFERI